MNIYFSVNTGNTRDSKKVIFLTYISNILLKNNNIHLVHIFQKRNGT